MNRFIAVISASVLLLCAWVGAAAAAPVAFEVVSIKAVPQPTPNPAGTGMAFKVDQARVFLTGYPLFLILTRAFRVQSPQLDAPDFTHSEFFEIQAKVPEGAEPEQVPEMLQTMLAERFKLAYHREARDYKMDVLSVGKNGMKLPRLAAGTPGAYSEKQLPDGSTRITQTGTVTALFPVMNSFGGLQMVDETGLDGIYRWVREMPPPAPGGSLQDYQAAEQDSFRAMIEAAGLRLETRKVKKETIVVDHLEKVPTEN